MKAINPQQSLISSKISIQTQATITDFQYNYNGTQLAVADSDGVIYLYTRVNNIFKPNGLFRGYQLFKFSDIGAIWKLAWADPTLGQTIAIGSFKGKIAIFTKKTNEWIQINHHQIQQASINHVEWAQISFGPKLFFATNQGDIGILQIKNGLWNTSVFAAHQTSITSFSLKSLPLNRQGEQIGNSYPILASVGKDNLIKIWKHTNDISEQNLKPQSRIYQQLLCLNPHKACIRGVLWRKIWGQSLAGTNELFTYSEDGSVKLLHLKEDKIIKQAQIVSLQRAIYKIQQSITGDFISISYGDQETSTILLFESQSTNQWEQSELIL